MNDLQRRITALAAELVKQSMASGLTWDEAVSALGLASKALAVQAAEFGGIDEQECVETATNRLAESMKQRVAVQVRGMRLH